MNAIKTSMFVSPKRWRDFTATIVRREGGRKMRATMEMLMDLYMEEDFEVWQARYKQSIARQKDEEFGVLQQP